MPSKLSNWTMSDQVIAGSRAIIVSYHRVVAYTAVLAVWMLHKM